MQMWSNSTIRALSRTWNDVGEGGHDTYYVPATMHNFQDDLPEHDYSSATASYGLSSLTQYVKDNGGEIRYETALVKLDREENSRVTGVIAKNDKGEYIRINASKGVVLCHGGYAYNKQMLVALNPDAYLSTVQADASALIRAMASKQTCGSVQKKTRMERPCCLTVVRSHRIRFRMATGTNPVTSIWGASRG